MGSRYRVVVVALCICAAWCACQASEKKTTPCAAAKPEWTHQQIVDVMRKVCDYQLTTATGVGRNDWIRSAFYTGVMATYRTTGDEKYLQAAIKWGEEAKWTPNPKDQRHADNLCCGQVYSEIYAIKKDPAMIEPFRQAIDKMLASPRKGREDWWWCDALFMAPTAIARLAAVTGDAKYLAFLHEMWWDSTDFLFDPGASLYFRDKNYFNAKTRNGQKVFWSRGNGWVVAGTARVLQYLPPNDPKREEYITLFKKMCAALKEIQGDDGMWRSSLLDRDEFPMPEASGSAFFCYGMAWGINEGILDRKEYLPVVTKAWKGLLGCLNEEGRVGYVQAVAGAPGPTTPDSTHEYAAGGFLLAGSEMARLVQPKWLFDFGGNKVAKGYTAVGVKALYSAQKGYGWQDTYKFEERDRGEPDLLRRDYIFSRVPAVFQVDVEPGIYQVKITMGDMMYGDHKLQVAVNASGVKLPELTADAAEFAVLTAAFEVSTSPLVFSLTSSVNNWALNALEIEPAAAAQAPKVVKTSAKDRLAAGPPPDTWVAPETHPDPTAQHLDKFKKTISSKKAPKPTGMKAADYLKVIAGNVDFFKQHQNADGAIIDPYKKEEWQYSTPAFAHAATMLVKFQNRKDLIEPAAKAMDWASLCLKEGKGATHHDDFYPPMLAHALPILKEFVEPARAKRWEDNLGKVDPLKVYRSKMGHGNWNVVALSGEYLLHKLGLRKDITFVEQSLAGQGNVFNNAWGLYVEGPMPYDLFPRIWASDMIAQGYDGKRSKELAEYLRRGALTSLFMQSPNGELPAGGRSTHHQWNEAEQCLVYEIYAAKAAAEGDAVLAGAFKRGAHLALGSIQRWIRPSGEMWIVKNHFDPSLRHGFDGYSAHSQYNLLPMSMLSIAYEYALKTEQVAEQHAPCEVGGFVLDLRDPLHKVIANAGGMYVEVDPMADHHYNPTGLLRIHKKGFNPQLGPSDGLVSHPSCSLTTCSRTLAAVGVAWQDLSGNWKRLAEYDRASLSRVSLLGVEEKPDYIEFQLVYQGYFSGPSFVSERYRVTPDEAVLASELPDYSGPMQMVWPMLADDGQKKTDIKLDGKTASVRMDGDTQTFEAVGAASVSVGDELYGYRNGLARLAVAEYTTGTKALLRIRPNKKP